MDLRTFGGVRQINKDIKTTVSKSLWMSCLDTSGCDVASSNSRGALRNNRQQRILFVGSFSTPRCVRLTHVAECVLPVKWKKTRWLPDVVCMSVQLSYLQRRDNISFVREAASCHSGWLIAAPLWQALGKKGQVCVGACMWGWGVDDGTRMHSVLRSHQQLWGALLSWVFFFF